MMGALEAGLGKRPSTPALRLLAKRRIPHEVHTYDYVERGGARASSSALGVPLEQVVKTLVFETGDGDPVVVLMHGDREVSAKELARALGQKRVQPCKPEVAERHSGYRVGGTSPFGTRKRMPVCIEASILELPRIWLNGGARGLLVSLDPAVLPELLDARSVHVAR